MHTARRNFATRYYIINYQYVEDAFYKRIPMRSEHKKKLDALQTAETKVIAAPHFPYDQNTIMVSHEDNNAEDGGLSTVQNFVENDPYVKGNIVEKYSIREFKLNGITTEFDRLSRKFIVRS